MKVTQEFSTHGCTKAIVIYHSNCTDGFGAAWIFHRTREKEFPGGVQYAPMDYNSILPLLFLTVDKNTIVYILDFSLDVEVLLSISKQAGWVLQLDHHISAQKKFHAHPRVEEIAMSQNVEVVFDMERSGAMLAYNKFSPIIDPSSTEWRLISYLQDYDLWQFRISATKEFMAALRSYPQTFEHWTSLYNGWSANAENWNVTITEGVAILRYFQQQKEAILEETAELCTILDHKGMCANCNYLFASEIGHDLAEQTGTFGATYYKRHDGAVKWSLRSVGDFDVASIAEQFGGGGHKNAAGFILFPDTSPEIMEGIKMWRVAPEGESTDERS